MDNASHNVPAEPPSRDAWVAGVVAVLLFAVTVVAYVPALRAGFVNYDDGVYVTDNPMVRSGLNAESVVWAFTNGHSGTWQPLAWLSHMSDCAMYGMKPWGHHLTNVILHGLNAVVLFLALRRMTKRTYPSLFVAAVFALHPIHVESVAWVSERKDVLSTFFAMLTLWAYAAYCERPSLLRYAMTVAWLGLGLLAKPMLVTIPCVLLLLDYWPLGRWTGTGNTPSLTPPVHGEGRGRGLASSAFVAARCGASSNNGFRLVRLLLEKMPHLALAIVFSALTVWVQRGAGATSSLAALPMALRLKNAAYSYVLYGVKAFWPSHLAAFYPHPGNSLTTIQASLCVLLLAAITITVILARARSPYLPVGWFWYLGTLVPVIGIVQVGVHGLADRYTYFPLIGLTIVVAWGVSQLADTKLHVPPKVLRVAGALAVAVLAWRTWVQAGYWANSETLFRHALAVTGENAVAERGLAKALITEERYLDALPHVTRAAELNPGNAENQYNLGIVLQNLGQPEAAAAAYTRATELDPGYSEAYNNLGTILLGLGHHLEAVKAIAKAVKTDPKNREAAENYGAALFAAGRPAEAEAQLRPLVERTPNDPSLHQNLGLALAAQGKYAEAREQFELALRLQPNFPKAQQALRALPKQ